jgi:succinate dehydrogenase / fumarate reductase membrane anchor subunit
MSLQSPLNKVLGLGSAQQGTGHWWAQRLTAISLAPLTIWFAIALLGLPHGNYEMVVAWIAEPLNSILIVLLIMSLIYHSNLGLQVVIEDYVHGAAKLVVLITVQFAHVVLAVSGIYAVIVVAVGVRQ